jgi:small redox-active disulfide protein 2
MKVEILGTGCAKCVGLYNNAEQALIQMACEYQLEKVEDLVKIMEYGVMNTPGFVVDGEVKSTGKLLSVAECKAILEA